MSNQSTSVQYRIVVDKHTAHTSGPDDAAVTMTVPVEAIGDGFDATVAFMRGQLKATGDSGLILALLRDGDADAALAALARS